LSYVPSILPIAAVLEVITSARRREELCAGKSAAGRENAERKLTYWAYRALIRIAKISKPSALFATKDLAVLLKEAFATTITACKDASTIETLCPTRDAQSTGNALPPLQLELLLQMPVAMEMAFLVQACLDACPTLSATLR
jgi:hypothetical protein